MRIKVKYKAKDPDLSSNGGSYDSIREFEYEGNGKWRMLYDTSADFDYCRYGMGFRTCNGCSYFDDEDGCKHEPIYVTFREVIGEIIEAVVQQDDRNRIRISVDGECIYDT